MNMSISHVCVSVYYTLCPLKIQQKTNKVTEQQESHHFSSLLDIVYDWTGRGCENIWSFSRNYKLEIFNKPEEVRTVESVMETK